MTKPMISLVPVIVAIIVPAVASAVGSSRAQAADECLSAPNSTAPQGQHWYYRIERPSKRRCWFLASKDTQIRSTAVPKKPAKMRVRATPKPIAALSEDSPATPAPRATPAPPATPAPKQVSQATPDMPAVKRVAQATPQTPAEAEIEPPVSEVRVADTAFGKRWSDVPTYSVSPAREQQLRMSFAEELSTIHSDDDMPLVWPVLSPAERQLAEQPQAMQVMLAFVAGAFASFAIFGSTIFKLSAARIARRRHRSSQASAGAAPIERRRQEPQTPARLPAQRPADRADEAAAARRRKRMALKRLAPSALSGEEDWLRLLHDRRRVAA